MCDQVRLIRREHAAQIAEVVEFAAVGERRGLGTLDVDREGGLITEHAEEDDLILVHVFVDVVTPQQYGVHRFAGRQTPLSPHWHEPAGIAPHGVAQPLGVFPQVTVSFDVGARKYVLAVHS